MVWVAFCFKSRSPICFISNNVYSAGFIELLDNVLIPFLDGVEGPSMIFLQDNAPIHTSRIVMDWLNTKNIPLPRWPALSPKTFGESWLELSHSDVKYS